jgi:erythromycin esterase
METTLGKKPLDNLRHYPVYKLGTFSRNESAGDLAVLSRIAGKARVVAVGEGAHFMKEYWTTRQALFAYFHEKHHFNIFAMEFGFAEGFTLNKWIGGEGGETELEKYSETAANWGAGETVKWLRQYNASVQDIYFAGIDVPEAAGSLLSALLPFYEYAIHVEPQLETSLNEAISISQQFASLSSVTAAIKWKKLSAAQQDRLTAILSQVRLRLESLSSYYIAKSSQWNYAVALQQLEAAICAEYMIRSVALAGASQALPVDASVREYFMANAVMWHLQAHPASKLFLVAHNNHIQKTKVAYGTYEAAIPAGYYLKQRLGDDYCAIALTSTDNHTAEMEIDDSLPVGFRVVDMPLEKPIKGSINAFLTDNNLTDEITLTDMKTDWTVDFNSIRSQSAFVNTSVREAFDAVINLPKVTLDNDVLFQ